MPPPQGVPSVCSRQAPAPSQPPARPQGAARSAGHSVLGSWASGTGVQLPTAPGRLQAWQVEVQALPQQTPSTQKLLPHSSAVMQARPMVFLGRQTEVGSQNRPAWQGFAAPQGAGQRPALQPWVQTLVVGGEQIPLPSQVRLEDSTV